MLSYNKLEERYPDILEQEPDTQLILFANKLIELDIYPENLAVLIGMLKYIFKNGIKGNETEFKLLLNIYEAINKN